MELEKREKRFFNSERTVLLVSFLLMLLFVKATYDEVIADKNRQLDVVQKEIDESRAKIRDNAYKTSALEKQVDSVEAAILTLDNFLKDYTDQRFLSPDEIAIETNMVLFLEDDVDKIQHSFKNKIINLYKHGKNYELELLMSSKTPNEYLRRNQYLQKFSQNRKKELRELKSKKFLLEEKKKMVTLSVSSQRIYIEIKRNERTVLNAKLQDLKNKKMDIDQDNTINLARIDRKQNETTNIKSFIGNLNQFKSSYTGNKTTRLNYSIDDMEKIKGNLNPPVDIPLIRNEFGEITNNMTGTKLQNNGVDFSISKGSKVYASAPGIVSMIGDVPFYGKVIVINIDNVYRMVYGCLSETNVKTGDKVKLNQIIGKSGSNLEGQLFHFEIWKDRTPLNPREWVRL
ncbi:MAG: hypothetical protein EHM58_18130 [Ignavibacteriae bacterium]|nr:MAG: hypothetical protein EHM58_18130 [Ignavibacteriota bacterium]